MVNAAEYTHGGAKNTKNSISVAAASRDFFFTFSYGENKSNECCASWQDSQIYFGSVPPPTQHNTIRIRRVYTIARKFFFSYPFIFPFVSGQNNRQTRRNPIHGQSPFCKRKRGSKIKYSFHLSGRRGTSLNSLLPRTPPARKTKTIIKLLLLLLLYTYIISTRALIC